MNRIVFGLVVALFGLWAGVASADVLWDFSSTLGAVGSDKVYSSGGYAVEAHAFITPGVDGMLFEKSAGPEEQGVGVCPPACPSDHEIQVGSWLRVDLAGAAGLQAWQINIDTVQPGEAYSLYTSASPTAFGAGTSCGTNLTADMTVPLCGGAPSRYVFLTATAGDIDLHTLQARVPAPAALLLLGAGLLGLVGWRGRDA